MILVRELAPASSAVEILSNGVDAGRVSQFYDYLATLSLGLSAEPVEDIEHEIFSNSVQVEAYDIHGNGKEIFTDANIERASRMLLNAALSEKVDRHRAYDALELLEAFEFRTDFDLVDHNGLACDETFQVVTDDMGEMREYDSADLGTAIEDLELDAAAMQYQIFRGEQAPPDVAEHWHTSLGRMSVEGFMPYVTVLNDAYVARMNRAK